MADLDLTNENITRTPVRFVFIRWGGGAEPGCYHLFPSGLAMSDYRGYSALPVLSLQCVVDDFGNLRRVQ